MDSLVGSVPKRAADTNRRGIILKIASDFSDDHWHGIGGEFHADRIIEIVDGFDQPNAANLEQIVYIFIIAGKSLDYA